VRLVLVEDSPDYSTLVREMLREELGGRVELTAHQSLTAAEPDLTDPGTDCVLLDLSLPDARGLDGLERVQAIAPHMPVVVLSGDSDQRIAIDAVSSGAQDYLVKRDTRAALLARAIRYAIERKRVELELTFLALHDSLTGLANRALFIDRLELALLQAKRRDTWVAVMFIDLDRFKTINDSLGHALGDRVLIEFAGRLRTLVRPGDTVARFGGDEFMVLCDELADESDAVRVAERLTAGLAEKFEVDGREIHIEISAGVSLTRGGEGDGAELIRNADQSMYRAKQETRRYALFDEATHANSLRRLALEGELHGAVARGELRLHYQPIIDLGALRTVGFEALVRWEHRERGLLHPADFLDLAAAGLMFELGSWVLGEACRQLAAWSRRNPALFMSVNLSPRELLRPELPAAVAETLAITGVRPSQLCLEVTEDSVASDPARLVGVLASLRAEGARIAIDDFGTGHSSLSALAHYPIDAVKLDRTFLGPLTQDSRHERMLKAVIDAAHAFALTVVAEGVEREEQLATIHGLGCDEVQGFLFSRPVPAEEAERLLEE
jgi:diguanylate cyclase (GGDEF)-like protein